MCLSRHEYFFLEILLCIFKIDLSLKTLTTRGGADHQCDTLCILRAKVHLQASVNILEKISEVFQGQAISYSSIAKHDHLLLAWWYGVCAPD